MPIAPRLGLARTGAADPATKLALPALMPAGRLPLLLVVVVQGAEGGDVTRHAIHAEIAHIATCNVELAAEGLFD